MNKEGRNNSGNESEIENKVVTVGSTQSHRALMVIILVLLVGGVYYLYFSPSSNEENVEVIKKEETKQNVQELKGKLERVPDNIVVPERIITDPLPPLPPLPTPQVIPEVKQIKKEEVVKKEEEKPKGTPISNMPVLPKQNFPYGNITSNLPTSFSTIGGGGYPKDRRGAQMLAISGGDKEDKAADAILSNTSAQLSTATKVGKLGFMITQGKIIDAVLETAIDSDLQGMLRAVVSSNVYAETGDTVLIPKGSRLIGGYSFDSNVARARININWNRIILPHGIDIAISSPGTDELGRAGIAGIVDNKIASALFSSIMLAGVSIGTAVIGQKASNLVDSLTAMDAMQSIAATEIDAFPLKKTIIKGIKDSTIQQTVEGAKGEQWRLSLGAIEKIRNAKNEQDLLRIFKKELAESLGIEEDKVIISLEDVTQLLKPMQKRSKSVYDEAIGKSINDFSKDMRDIVKRSTDKKPTVYVDQGTALKVFVNQDIVFPPQAILNQ